MNSKEALERIETIFPYNREYKPNYYTQFSSSYEPFYKDFDCIKQDLDRLEKLEKVIEILKEKLDIKLEIYHNGGCILNHKIISNCVIPNERCLRYLEVEEYKLLKEVLGYGR